MRIDPRFQVGLGLSVHAVFLCHSLVSATAVLGIVLLAWITIRQIPTGVFLLWAGFQAVLVAIFFLGWMLGHDTLDYTLWTLLHWSAGLIGGFMVILWPGVENLAKVVLRLPLPYFLTRSFGFALRTVPILGSEINSHARNLKILGLLGSHTNGRRRLALGISEILTQTIDGIDKVITQIETRGFDPQMFGNLESLTMTRGNLIALWAMCAALVAPFLFRFF